MDRDSPEMEYEGRKQPWTPTAKKTRQLFLCSLVMLIAACICLLVFILLAAGVIPGKQRPVNCPTSRASTVTLTKDTYGKTKKGKDVDRFIFKNKNEMELHVITLGGIMTVIKVPDKMGKLVDVALGYKNLAGYEDNGPYLGTLVGRYANRIKSGMFSVDGTTYHVTINNGPNSLHGGINGWHKAIWAAKMDTAKPRLTLTHISPDGDEGFPGEVTATVDYELTEDNQIYIRFKATTKGKATPINLTSHGYFNLAGQGTSNIYDHKVTIYADKYPVVDNKLIPTGEIRDVAGSVYDLRSGLTLGDIIFNVTGGGYDNTFVLRGPTGRKLAAKVEHPPSGRIMEVYTNQPGVQFYTGNFLNETNMKGGMSYGKHSAFCLETQNYPDAPNHNNFPDSVLRPNFEYTHEVWYKFMAV